MSAADDLMSALVLVLVLVLAWETLLTRHC